MLSWILFLYLLAAGFALQEIFRLVLQCPCKERRVPDGTPNQGFTGVQKNQPMMEPRLVNPGLNKAPMKQSSFCQTELVKIQAKKLHVCSFFKQGPIPLLLKPSSFTRLTSGGSALTGHKSGLLSLTIHVGAAQVAFIPTFKIKTDSCWFLTVYMSVDGELNVRVTGFFQHSSSSGTLFQLLRQIQVPALSFSQRLNINANWGGRPNSIDELSVYYVTLE